MFINCPYCRTLVATDPVTDLPPTHCPQCKSLLRRDATVEEAADTEGDGAPLDLIALMNTPAMDAPAARTKPTSDIATPGAVGSASTAIAPEHEREPPRDAVAIENAAGPATASGHRLDAQPESGDNDAVGSAVPAAAPTSTPTAAAGKRGSRAMPSFARVASAANKVARERWVPWAILALAILLILQLLLADRARLSADARWRPTLHALCATLFCELPPWREPAAFTLLQRDVRQHPSIPGALRVSATFRNDARWPQPWPRLRLRLSDANGRPAGERDFLADDYLGGPASQSELANGESATVAMDILEPAAQIVGYDFGFR